jgi:hypothetical protein
MAAMWVRPVGTDESFDNNVDGLRARYSEIDSVVDTFKNDLANNPKLTRMPLGGELFAQRVDYPPLGADGIQRFLVIYHAPPGHQANPMQQFTLLAILER